MRFENAGCMLSRERAGGDGHHHYLLMKPTSPPSFFPIVLIAGFSRVHARLRPGRHRPCIPYPFPGFPSQSLRETGNCFAGTRKWT
jgi:hypothetical protein